MQFTANPTSEAELADAAKRALFAKLPRPSYLLKYMRAAVRGRKQDLERSPGIREQRKWLEKDVKGFMSQLEKLERDHEKRRREAAEKLGLTSEGGVVEAAAVVEAVTVEDAGTDRSVGLMDRLIAGWKKETPGSGA